MNYDASVFSYFLNAGIVVKSVMLLLIGSSIFSWAFIIQRALYLKWLRMQTNKFEQQFWSGEELNRLYMQSDRARGTLNGLESIFHAGFKEFLRFKKQGQVNLDCVIDNTKRAMRVAEMRAQDKLEARLSFLAMVGSISPYVGLFGTVWGIMQSLGALANVQQASVSMVAPGMSEALVATALGLLAAIPAVIAYNRFVADTTTLMNRFTAFQDELVNVLVRQNQVQTMPEIKASSSSVEYGYME